MPKKVFADLFDELLAEGVVTITAEQLAERASTSLDSVYVAMHRAKAARRLFSPARGLYVLVPPEYRSWGAVPADWFIDDLMAHLGCRYHVALLSAAARHGAAHQAAQVFQVATERRVNNRDIAGLRLRFYRAADLAARPTVTQQGPTGRIIVATAETCALDLAERPEAAGGVNTVLEVLADLVVDGEELAAAAAGRSRAVARRCGWMLEHSREGRDLEALLDVAAPHDGNATPLVTGGLSGGDLDHRWGIRVNTSVEASA